MMTCLLRRLMRAGAAERRRLRAAERAVLLAFDGQPIDLRAIGLVRYRV